MISRQPIVDRRRRRVFAEGKTRLRGLVAATAALLLLWTPAEGQDFQRVSSERAMSAAKKKDDPVYPPMAKRMGVEGVVEIDVFIDEAGKVLDAKKVAGHPVLVNAAIKAVKKWEFDPIGGRPAVTTLKLEFRQ